MKRIIRRVSLSIALFLSVIAASAQSNSIAKAGTGEKNEYADRDVDQTDKRQQANVEYRNRVAIMPLTYVGVENDRRSERMQEFLQTFAISVLRNSAFELKYLDAAEINALLLRNGINDVTVKHYTPADLARILHVEYVITGIVVQDEGSLVTVNNSYTTQRQNYRYYYERNRPTRRTHSTETSITRQNMNTQASIAIYDRTGENLYQRSRQSILNDTDAYRNAIQYLLKRCPLYKR